MHILHTVLFTFPNVLKKGEFVRQSRALLVDDIIIIFAIIILDLRVIM